MGLVTCGYTCEADVRAGGRVGGWMGDALRVAGATVEVFTCGSTCERALRLAAPKQGVYMWLHM